MNMLSQSIGSFRILFLTLVLLGSAALVCLMWGGAGEKSRDCQAEASLDLDTRSRVNGHGDGDALHHSSCLSRTQQDLLSRPGEKHTSRPAMPSRLRRRWSRYGERYRQCANSQGLGEGDDGHCQYVVFLDSENDGLGNRFMGLVSAMAFALATDRVLLIDNARMLSDLVCEPDIVANGSSWIVPAQFLSSLLRKSVDFSQYIRDEKTTEVVRVSLWDEPSDGDVAFFCEEHYASLAGVRWVTWRSDLYTIPNLFLVPSFWKRMQPLLGRQPEHSFALISGLFLFPRNDVWLIVLREHAAYLSGATRLKGIQIRLHGRQDPAAFDPAAHDMLAQCLVGSAFLPPALPAEVGDANATQLALAYSARRRAGSHVDTAVLVASLQGRYLQELREAYGRGAADRSVVRLHGVSALGRQDFSTRQSKLALAEMWLLSWADELATSASSTFGYAAQAWGGLKPLVLDFSAPAGPAASANCKAGYSSDPCSHLPRRPSCLRVADLAAPHQRWIQSHLRVCQDRPEGAWQLVKGSLPPASAASAFEDSPT